MADLLRLTLDTCIVTSAFRSGRGPSSRLMRRFYQGDFEMQVSASLLFEYESVLKRPEQRAIHGLSLHEVDEFLHDLASRLTPVYSVIRSRPQLRDPSDEFVLECALSGRADALVTYNVRDFLPAAERLGIRVVSPSSTLR